MNESRAESSANPDCGEVKSLFVGKDLTHDRIVAGERIIHPHHLVSPHFCRNGGMGGSVSSTAAGIFPPTALEQQSRPGADQSGPAPSQPARLGGRSCPAGRGAWLGLLNSFDLPFALALPVSLLALDLAIYLQHVLFHAVPVLWRLHRVHHADLEFDVTTGLCFHPIEILLSMG